MTVTHGMNVADVEKLGRLLQTRADHLNSIVGEIEASIRSTRWDGPDGRTFREQWWPDHRTRLLQIAERVQGFGQSALNNLTEQRQASDVASGGGTLQGSSPNLQGSSPLLQGAGAIGLVAFGASAATRPDGASAGSTGSSPVLSPRGWQEVSRSYEAWATGRFAAGGESYYQCTAWANFRWQELGYDGVISGNGGAMAGNAGSPLSPEPSLHAMASYGAGTSGDPGHVMIVEEVSADGSRIRISEMNTGIDGSGWRDGYPQEYRDTKWLTRGSDGTFQSWNGKLIQFATFPG